MTCLRLFWEFFKTGLFAVGGGLATLPFLYNISETTGWITTEDIANMIAISESTPGPLGVNMATYVGFQTVGIFGGIITTLGLMTAPIVVILIVSKIMAKFRNSQTVNRVFYGLRPASTALIASAGLGVAKITLLALERYGASGALPDLLNIPCILLCAGIFLARKKLNWHPIAFIAIAAVAGILFKL